MRWTDAAPCTASTLKGCRSTTMHGRTSHSWRRMWERRAEPGNGTSVVFDLCLVCTVCRAIYELAVSQSDLDMPELLWKAYVDMEIGEGEYERARALYKRLLGKSAHVKVWISAAQFESDVALPAGAATMATVRGVFTSGYDSLKWQELKEERVVLLEAWRDVETARLNQLQEALEAAADPAVDEAALRAELADAQKHVKLVESKFPKKIKMKRLVNSEDPTSGFEEYFDYAFPDDEKKIGKCFDWNEYGRVLMYCMCVL